MGGKKKRKEGKKEISFIASLFGSCGYGESPQEWGHSPTSKGGKRAAQLGRSLVASACGVMGEGGRERLERAKRDQMRSLVA